MWDMYMYMEHVCVSMCVNVIQDSGYMTHICLHDVNVCLFPDSPIDGYSLLSVIGGGGPGTPASFVQKMTWRHPQPWHHLPELCRHHFHHLSQMQGHPCITGWAGNKYRPSGGQHLQRWAYRAHIYMCDCDHYMFTQEVNTCTRIQQAYICVDIIFEPQ